MEFPRSSGVLLHPTSLPGRFGIGDLGPEAFRWLEFLAGSGCSLWQVLPLGPTSFQDSPYQAFSAFAGNPYLISPEALVTEDLLTPEDLEGTSFPAERVDYGRVIPWKLSLLDRAFERFEKSEAESLRDELSAFRSENAGWIEEFALFMALKEANQGKAWPDWPAPRGDAASASGSELRGSLGSAPDRQVFRQFLFFRQWGALRTRAAELGVRILGDAPIFVALDSADVWAHRRLFHLDETGKPTVVAGVPPDYFSATGQLWGNPLYRWEAHAQDGYRWWVERFRTLLKLVDIVRLDHFRGFAAGWEVPAGGETAEKGRWAPGPGSDFLGAVRGALGDLPFIAEDLGEITPDVVALRDGFGLPGMKILQFAFSAPENPFLPHHYPRHCVVYTGTHDNDTSRGWFLSAPDGEREFCRQYLARDGSDIAGDLIRAAWASVATFALAPMQDLLDLGSEARMNHPGRPSGTWTWRMPAGSTSRDLQARLQELNFLYQRGPSPRK